MTSNGRSDLATMPYPEYLQTPEWKERAEAAKKRAGYRCQVCNSPKQLQAHHRDYDRRGHEDDGDLTVLCDDCHALYHGKGRLTEPAGLAPAVRPRPAVLTTWPAPTWKRRSLRRSLKRKAGRTLRRLAAPGPLVATIGIVLVVIGLAVLAVAVAARTG